MRLTLDLPDNALSSGHPNNSLHRTEHSNNPSQEDAKR